MPSVPIARNTVGVAEVTDAKLRSADFASAGEIVGRGIEEVGHGLSRLAGSQADYQRRVEDHQDNAATKEQVNGINAFYAEKAYTGEGAYFNKRGKDAMVARPDFDKALTDQIAAARALLKTDRQRQLFDDAITPQRQSWGVQIANHAQKETVTYDDEQSESRITLTGELFKNTFVADPTHAEEQLASGIAEIKHRGEINRWTPERVEVETLKFTSGALKDVGTRLAYEDGANGPKLADGLVKKYGSLMTADDREAVLSHARVQTNALEAEQRRTEAERRRQEREGKQDARERAQSVLRNLTDGIYVDPKVLATAEADARTAGDSALEEGIRQGGKKNAWTQEYAGFSPVDLQNEVNSLSVQIRKAGGKVDPDLMVKRDHLQKLLNNSTAELKTDSLSWGAKHLGLELPALNFNNPASINARVSAAQRVSRSAGVQAQPFTNEEAAQYTNIVANGSARERTQLALSLSRLGPLATAGAQQVAPNNDGFQNLVGLATSQNRTVAAALVNKVVGGEEALNTMPNLINNDEASSEFNRWVGRSFVFLPSVKNGVLANAKAIFASDASQAGVSDWDKRDRLWYRAVNQALGAYNSGGKQHGGLTTFNGAATILPEDMALEDFETRISRSNAPEFKIGHIAAAQAAGLKPDTPAYRNGQVPSSDDIKKMQWVPARDGVYRLSNGTDFLMRKDGKGYYEIDVRKLPSNFDAQLAERGYKRY